VITVRCECGETFHTEAEQTARFVECRRCGRFVRLVRHDNPARGATPVQAPTSADHSSTRVGSRFPGGRVGMIVGFVAAVSLGFVIGRLTVSQPTVAPAERAASRTREPSIEDSGPRRAPAEDELDRLARKYGVAADSPAATHTPRRVESLEERAQRLSQQRQIAQAGVRVQPSCRAIDPRPENAEELLSRDRGGHSLVTVDNGTSFDAVVALVAEAGRSVRRFYVRSGAIASALAIPVGEYRIRFALGTGLSDDGKGFCAGAYASEFDRTAVIMEYPTDQGIHYTEERLTLHKVLNGNVASHRIAAALVFRDSTF
jgi:hypothetical protein